MSATMTVEAEPETAHFDTDSAATARGVATGMAFSVPIWALIILVVHAIL